MNSKGESSARQLNRSSSRGQDKELVAKGRARKVVAGRTLALAGTVGATEDGLQLEAESSMLAMQLQSLSETTHGMFNDLEHVHLNASVPPEYIQEGILQAGAPIMVDGEMPLFADGSRVELIVACPCKSGCWAADWFPAPLASGTGPTLVTEWAAPVDEIRVIGLKSREAWVAWEESATAVTKTEGPDPMGDDNGRGLN